nr:MAG TPA: ECL1/2/3 zinc binding protein [Caudoviricetes sp.]
MVAKKMTYNKTCACCRKEYISDRKNGRFCSAECRNIIKSKEEAERYRRKKAEAEITAEITEVKETLAETVQKARDMGMSYGQYKAMIYKKMKGV